MVMFGLVVHLVKSALQMSAMCLKLELVMHSLWGTCYLLSSDRMILYRDVCCCNSLMNTVYFILTEISL